MKFSKYINKSLINRIYPYVILLIFPVFFFSKVIFSKTWTFFVNYDNVQQFYAWYQKLAISLHNGYLPIWDANTIAGHSFVGEFQQGVFYLPNILVSWIFGSTDGINVMYLEYLVMAHFVFASISMYLLCRRLNLSKIASVCTGIIFAYSGALASRAVGQTAIFFGICLIPIILYFIVKYFDTKKRKNLIFAGIILGMQILAGHIQPFFHTVILSVIYIVIRNLQDNKLTLASLKKLIWDNGILAGISILVASPQLILSYQYMKIAYRWVSAPAPIGPGEKVPYDTYVNLFNVQPQNILNFLDPQYFFPSDGNLLYIGAFSFFIILLFIFTSSARKNFMPFKINWHYIAIILIFSSMAMFGAISFLPYLMYRIPGFSQVRELGRYAIMFQFALCLMFGIAATYFIKFPTKISLKKKFYILVFLGLVGIQLYYSVFIAHTYISKLFVYSVVFACIFILSYYVMNLKKFLIAILIFVSTVSVIYLQRNTIITPVNPEYYAPNLFARNEIITFLEKDYGTFRVDDKNDYMPSNVGDAYKIQTVFGHGATMLKPYFDYLMQDGSIDSKYFDLLNVKYIVSNTDLPLKVVMEDKIRGYKLYERDNYYPRVFYKSQIGMKGEEIVKQTNVTLEKYQDNYSRYKIKLDSQQDVIFSEINYGGWKVYIDGKQSEIKTADIPGFNISIFRQISLSEGEHTVEFKYLL